MARTILAQLWPRNPADGTTVPLRLAGGGSTAYRQLGFSDWRAGVTNEPRYKTSIEVDQTGVTGSSVPQTAGIRFFPSDTSLLSTVSDLFWTNAPIQVNIGDDENPAETYPIGMKGLISAITVEDGAIVLTFADLSLALAKPVAPNVFAGTGDLEGGDDATGRVKRRSFGTVFNVEGRLLDKAYNIYEFGDPSIQLKGFTAVKDKGLASSTNTTVAWQGSAPATLQALRAASPPSGGAAMAPSIGCVKWWTVPAGPLTADIQGEDQQASPSVPTLVQYLLTLFSPAITITNLSDALSIQSGIAGWHVDDSSTTVAELFNTLCLPVSLIWSMNADGTLTFRHLTWAGPVISIAAREIAREVEFAPLRYRRVGFQANNRIHTDAEISATLLDATDLTYADGTPIETLKPASAGADKTSANTAAAIQGQGPGATAAGSAVLNDYGVALSTTNRVKFSQLEKGTSGWQPYPNGLTVTSFATSTNQGVPYINIEVKPTAANQAAGINNAGFEFPVSPGERLAVQAGIGSLNQAQTQQLIIRYFDGSGNDVGNSSLGRASTGAFNSKIQLFSTVPSGAIKGRLEAYVYSSGSGTMNLTLSQPMVTSALPSQTTYPSFAPGPNAIDAADVTNANTAAAITGQGSLATQNSADWQSQIFGTGKPSNNADKTSLNQAASVSGQGALATKNQTGYYDINLGDLVSQSSGSNSGGSSAHDGTTTVVGASGTLNCRPGGLFYAVVSAQSQVTDSNKTDAYNSVQWLASNGNIIAEVKLPFGPAPTGRLEAYVVLANNPNTTSSDTVSWRLIVRKSADGTAWSALNQVTATSMWKAI